MPSKKVRIAFPLLKALSDDELESSELLEDISSLVHEQWWDFAEKIAPEIDPEHAKAWEKLFVPYDELPEEEKEKDRVFAKRIVFRLQNREAPIHKALPSNTKKVYEYLRENYPSDVLGWVKKEIWNMRCVPLSKIKMARRPGGRDMNKVQRISDAIKRGSKMEPIVLVETKNGFKIADGYHRTLAYKHAGIKSIYAWVAEGEHGVGEWDRDMHDRKLNKSWGDAGVEPIANAPHRGQRASDQLNDWAAEDTQNSGVDVYTFYRRLLGQDAKENVSIEALEANPEGSVYLVSDGERTFKVYVPRIGTPRLLKALVTTYTPAANAVWSILRLKGGYRGRPKDGVARIRGCKVTVRGHDVVIEGKNADQLLRFITSHMKDMITTDAWVGGHMQLGQPSMTAPALLGS